MSRPYLPEGHKKIPITIKLSPELLSWIADQPETKTRLIELGLKKLRESETERLIK